MAFDFDAAVTAPFRMQPGLRRLAQGAARLTPSGAGSRHQREKLAVLSAFPDEALVAEPGFDAAPALGTLCRWAAQEHPTHFRWDGERAAALGVEVCHGRVMQAGAGSFGLGDEVGRCLERLAPPWRLPGLVSLAFDEDLAVLCGDTGRVPWLAVALPSHWDPRTRAGRHFSEIHAPVADNALLLAASDALARLVCGEQAWERFVWNVTGHPRLHAHPARVDPHRWPACSAADVGGLAWWRTERQTFIPVPGRPQALFTIRVEVTPLAQALEAPGRARRLQAAIESMSPAVLAYRSLAPVREPLLDWLRARSQ